MPGAPLYKFYARDRNGAPCRNFQPLNVFWGVREAATDNWGAGILPLLEILGRIDDNKIPTRNRFEQEMVALLRNFSPLAQVNDTTNVTEYLAAKEKLELIFW